MLMVVRVSKIHISTFEPQQTVFKKFQHCGIHNIGTSMLVLQIMTFTQYLKWMFIFVYISPFRDWTVHRQGINTLLTKQNQYLTK